MVDKLSNIVVACNTLRDEIKKVVTNISAKIPIIWVDSGLHDFPEKLNNVMQNQIDRIENVDNIILLFGRCGNSIVGLKSQSARIIIPRVDDCISMFLGGDEKKKELERKSPAYYFTRGYLENENNVWTEYMYCVQKYGSEKAKTMFLRLFKNYEKLRVIDTGAYEVEKILNKTNNIAYEFNLKPEVIEGSLIYIIKAFQEKWDEDFIIIEPGKRITYDDIY